MATIETIKKNNTEIKIGIGILTKNPMVVTERDLMYYRHIVWLNYDGNWYMTPFETMLDCQHFLHNNKTYTKEQLFDLVYEIIYGKYKG